MTQRIRAIIGMLVTVFVLGMAENLVGSPSSDSSTAHNIFSGIILALHVLTAIGIIVTATQLAKQAKDVLPDIKRQLGRGFGAVGVAFIAGILTLLTPSPWQEILSFVMAIGFISAIVFYGSVLIESSRKSR